MQGTKMMTPTWRKNPDSKHGFSALEHVLQLSSERSHGFLRIFSKNFCTHFDLQRKILLCLCSNPGSNNIRRCMLKYINTQSKTAIIWQKMVPNKNECCEVLNICPKLSFVVLVKLQCIPFLNRFNLKNPAMCSTTYDLSVTLIQW